MTKLEYRPLALDDLNAIFEIVGSDYPQRGYDFVEAIRERCRTNLLPTPGLGPSRQDLGQGIRIYPIKTMRVVVVYRVSDNALVIIRVFYGGADYAAAVQRMDDVT
ncbi:hypothetical protein JANAI62_37410 [Jannaschia pagri]|uniref:Toxin ParE1/3/4 n=1 Tax=Jannaschia pagri TaxID=2829797 RepID=A0ABQ4NRT4_9RHOB|nr:MULTISPECIES: type II toxin-antitoxin system RelE/ParE family toxin [unclassified Jannaschia]GIT93308.1 hypothetical protein JANAI61_37660 [Jannaschia sp. AI_61]GIT97118.1 hypothetical protein JANAI62_37410 [Jannaschia sp. AI_62]